MGQLVQHGLPCDACNSSDAVAEYSENYFCFSCEKSTPKSRREKSIVQSESTSVPPQYERQEINFKTDPDAVKELVEKIHLTKYLVEKYDIHYTSQLKIWSVRLKKHVDMGARLIIPHPGGFEAKTLNHSSIKYITYGHKDGLFFAHDWPEQVERVCIVEDIFSAIRIGEFMPCVALIGTNLTKCKESQLRRLSKKFLVWLDGDKAGRHACKRLGARLAWISDDDLNAVISKVTPKDPKCYSDRQLEDLLDFEISENE